MHSPDDKPPPFSTDLPRDGESARRPPFRFRVRTLLILTTLVAAACVISTVFPLPFSQLMIGGGWVLAASWLAMGALFGRGDRQAFCIGAVVVLSSMWTGVGGQFMEGVRRSAYFLGAAPAGAGLLWFDAAVLAAAAAGNGWFCVRARRYFERG
ncbi:hypothetical protein OAS39_05000 [Pirellulales bacterium]|nr:hypothetical protein [Pirellulales bacterium]